MWKVIHTDEWKEWFDNLEDEDQLDIAVRVEKLEEQGAGLGRPLVDTISHSKHPNMKELRCGTIRILFAFDPKRQAILLLGGDKYKKWKKWYRKAIPEADRLLDQHLAELDREGG